MQDCKFDNQGGEVVWRWGAGTLSLTKEGGGWWIRGGETHIPKYVVSYLPYFVF